MNPDLRTTGTYELPRGTAVGKYEIMRRLAVGGMAEIYLARITGAAGFEKLVVLKRILPNVAEDPTFVNMFLDEAKLAATLRHPHIADVYDVGECDGTYFFTMEYVYGEDVRTIRHDVRKRNEPIPLAIALAIVHGVASALDHAHEKLGPDGKRLDLVHRDVSASNIMVSYDGAVKLLDFGIARAASSTHKTQTGTLKGKIPYMSPEQCKGLPLDRRSDLFSLGVVLYELTVGKRPFRGETDFAIMDQIVYQGAKPPSEVVSGYPPELEAIVMKLLARGPSARYSTGEELLRDLDELIAKHGLWMSARAIGKYMRTLFADKIAAWEQAEQEGVPFAQHVVASITSQSQRSELLTPPTDFPAIEPRSASQEMAAVQAPIGRRTSKPMPAMKPLVPVSPLPLPAPAESNPFGQPLTDSAPFARQSTDSAPFARQSTDSAPFARQSTDSAPFARQSPDSGPAASFSQSDYARQSEAFARESEEYARKRSMPIHPSRRSRSGRTIALAFVGALVLGAGGAVGYLLNKSNKPAAAVEAQEPTKQMETLVPPTAEAAKAEPKTDVNAEAKPTVDVKAAPKATPTVAEPTVDVKAAPTVEPTVPVVDRQPTVPDQRAATEAEPKPVAPKAAAHATSAPKKPIVPKPVRAAKPKKPSTAKEPKEQTWDPNSPFLPQQ